MKKLVNFPNTLTASRILLTPVFLSLVFAESWYLQNLALVVFVGASLTDLYDGRFARKDGAVTRLGRFLDPLADKILISSALISFVVLDMVEVWLVAAILIRDAVITSLRTYAICRGKQMVTSKLAKWKTTIQLLTVLVILGFMNLRVTLAEFDSKPGFLHSSWTYRFLNGLMVMVMLVTVISGACYLLDNNRYQGSTMRSPLSTESGGRIADSG